MLEGDWCYADWYVAFDLTPCPGEECPHQRLPAAHCPLQESALLQLDNLRSLRDPAALGMEGTSARNIQYVDLLDNDLETMKP